MSCLIRILVWLLKLQKVSFFDLLEWQIPTAKWTVRSKTRNEEKPPQTETSVLSTAHIYIELSAFVVPS